VHAEMSQLMSESHRGDSAVEIVAHDDSPPLPVSGRTIRFVRQWPSVDAVPSIERNSRERHIHILWPDVCDRSAWRHRAAICLADVPDRRNSVPLHRPRSAIDIPRRRNNPDAGRTTRNATSMPLPPGPTINPHGIRHLQLDQNDIPERLTMQNRCRVKPTHPLTIRPVPPYLRIDSSAEIINSHPKSVPCSPMAATHETRVMISRRSLNPAERIQDLVEGEQWDVVQACLARARECRRLHLNQVHFGEKLDLRAEQMAGVSCR
jgi:hypothetical protein